ncbi:hypothetical protein BJ875DRAFT_202844 [Amylocarpus encephaloides]|uniref:Uncharacterized protein n=1 Tax=Amylocarpus encephaloides TaxID=45428 RepID=A0A9P7Y8V3_9HELO|nr:hypothetical protein BJ875DRAFT_202844 [Amylocarpus encephaloides]
MIRYPGDQEHGVRFRGPSRRQYSDLSIEEIRREFPPPGGTRTVNYSRPATIGDFSYSEPRRRNNYVEPIPPAAPQVYPTRGILRESGSRVENDGGSRSGSKQTNRRTHRNRKLGSSNEATSSTAGYRAYIVEPPESPDAPDVESKPRDASQSPVGRSGDSSDPFPRNKWTRIPSSSMSRGALSHLEYPFEEKGSQLFILKEYLATDNFEELYLRALEKARKDSSSPSQADREPSRPRLRSRVSDSSLSGVSSDSDVSYYPRPRWGTRRKISPSDDGPEVFSFKLSRYKKGLLNRDSTVASTAGISEKDFAVSPTPSTNVPRVGKLLHVVESHYTGDGALGGDQSAVLKVAEDTNAEARQTPSIFKWLQIEDESMNLDRFETAAKTLAGLTDLQKAGITRLFKRIRKNCDKPIHTSNGSNVRFMAPTILSTPIGPEPREQREKSQGERSIIWMCLPYFLLQKYAGVNSGLPPASHPVRTLLQTHSSFAQKKRDMQQAVCKLPGSRQEHCFHIAQVWCLVVDESFLVTCSRNSISFLMGKYISISTERSSPDVSRTRRRPRSRTRSLAHLLVYSGDSLWSFPLDECQTWFAFLLHFWEYVPRRLQFLYGRRIITRDSWPNILELASKVSIQISMVEVKTEVKNPSGILFYSQPSSLNLDSSQFPQRVSPQQRDANNPPSNDPAAHADTQNTSRGTFNIGENEGAEDPSRLPSRFPKNATENKWKGPQTDLQNDALNRNFHVFAWMNEVQPKTWRILSHTKDISPNNQTKRNDPFTVDEMNLRVELKEIDRYLTSQAVFEDRTAYLECDERSRHEIYSTLAMEKEEITALNEKDLTRSKIYEDKIDVVNKAETVFRFFLPSQFEGSTIGKFWGALGKLLSNVLSLA